MTKVLVIDDHPGLRQSLVSALEKQTSGFAFLQAKDGTEAQSLLAQNADCRMLLLDVKLGVENGLAVLSELRQLRPDVRVLVYSAFAEPLQIVDAIRAGVQGYITKTAELSEIVEAVRAVADGKPSFCHEAQAVMQAMTDESMFNGGTAYSTSDDERHTLELFRRYRTLTPKEQQVFLLLARKYDVPDIAAALQKSVKTVENQRSAVYAKLGIHDRLGAVEAARVLGIGE
ncbi:MAG: response regulator transcription factor [Treponema sp.]|nr:response regulator transcription factor [Treponema sp.]